MRTGLATGNRGDGGRGGEVDAAGPELGKQRSWGRQGARGGLARAWPAREEEDAGSSRVRRSRRERGAGREEKMRSRARGGRRRWPRAAGAR